MKSLLLTAILSLLSPYASATNTSSSTLTITEARIFAPLKGSNATGGYGLITNTSSKTVVVKIENAEAFKAIELHETVEKNGRMAMQKIETLTLAPKQSFELKPGGHHIMLFDPVREMKVDELVKVTLRVDNKSESFDFKIVPRMKPASHPHHP